MENYKQFTLKLIESVKKRRCIWDFTDEAHSKKRQVTKSWKEVSEEVKKDIGYCRAKWKNVRIGFLRSLREQPGIKKRRFYLYDELEFLIPYSLKNEQKDYLLSALGPHPVANINEESLDTEMLQDPLKQEDQSSCESLMQDANATREETPSTSRDIPSVIQQNGEKTETQKSDYLKYLTGKKTQETAWLSFFQGVIPDVLLLSEQNQLLLKKRLMELIFDLRTEETTT